MSQRCYMARESNATVGCGHQHRRKFQAVNCGKNMLMAHPVMTKVIIWRYVFKHGSDTPTTKIVDELVREDVTVNAALDQAAA